MSTSTSQFYRTSSSRLVILVLAILGSMWLLVAGPLIRASVELPESATSGDVQRNQVVIRTTPTNSAGIGSVVTQLRSGAAVAAMLGATFATFSVESEHAYQVASLLSLDLLETRLDARTKVCSLTASPGHARTSELVEGWCGNGTFADAQALELRESLSDCDLILDDRPWEARYDMSKCTWRWVKHVFSTLGTRKRAGRKRAGGIGLHIRWGDMANDSAPGDPRIPERSTPIETAARLLRKLRECDVEDELSVYMESQNATMLSGLGEPYRIVDTGDDVDDLIDLASNRLIVLGLGSYAVLAHQIAEGGITVVPDTDLFGINWYDNGVNHVLRMHELLSIACSDLSLLFSL